MAHNINLIRIFNKYIRISCKVTVTIFEQKNKHSINFPKCLINHIIQIVVFDLCCYFRFIFIPRNCSFKSLFQISKTTDIFVYKQSYYRDRNVSTIYLRCWSSCFCSCCSWIRHIGNHYICSWYFKYYEIFWPWQIKFYFTVT